MSNTNTNSVEFDVVPCTDALETIPETAESTQSEAPAPKKNTAACRIFSLILIAVSIAALFLPIQVLKVYTPKSTTLFASLIDLFSGGEATKLFYVLPVYTIAANVVGMFAGIVFYALLLEIALTVIFGLIALFNGKTCMFHTAAFFFATGFGTYAVCGYALPAIKGTATELDLITVAIAAAGALLYLILAFAKKGKKAFGSLIQLLLTLVFIAVTIKAFNSYTLEIKTALKDFLTFTLTIKIVFTAIWILTLLGAVRLLTKKGLAFDLIRYIVELLIGALLCYIAFTVKAKDTMLLIYAIVAAVIALVQIVACAIQIKSEKPKKEVEDDDLVDQPALAPVPEYTVEEYAEALPYEGGPVEGVEIAQEVNPTFEENPSEPVRVNTAGYDFYNSKSFDPFIASLNAEERNQFTELFVLKYKGVMPEIPDYQVGGDNKDFFRKIFIYLGQYRDRIPDGLLAKIYQFAIRNS